MSGHRTGSPERPSERTASRGHGATSAACRCVIDAATGSWNPLDTTTVRCSLEPAEAEAAAPARPSGDAMGVARAGS